MLYRALLVLMALLPASLWAQSPVRYFNPSGLTKPTSYTHVVVAADGRTVYIAGQVAFDSTGQVVGPGDFLITDLKQVAALRDVRARYFKPERPPANTLIPVATLARADLLLGIEAVAVLPSPTAGAR